MKNKEIKVLDKLDRLARKCNAMYYGLPINEEIFQQDTTTILKEYSKDNALLFANWIGENYYVQSMEGNWFYQGCNKQIAKDTEELYNLFLADQNK